MRAGAPAWRTVHCRSSAADAERGQPIPELRVRVPARADRRIAHALQRAVDRGLALVGEQAQLARVCRDAPRQPDDAAHEAARPVVARAAHRKRAHRVERLPERLEALVPPIAARRRGEIRAQLGVGGAVRVAEEAEELRRASAPRNARRSAEHRSAKFDRFSEQRTVRQLNFEKNHRISKLSGRPI